jgi:carbon monoxide dehydrogenase subunit G
MRGSLQVDVEVDAPAEATWQVLTDWDRQHEWALLTRTRGIGPTGGHAVGEQVHAVTGLRPLGFLDSMVITQWDPPALCEVRKPGRVVRGQARFEVTPLGPTRSRVTYRAEVDLPAGRLGALAWPLVRAGIAGGFAVSLRRLARIAERRHVAPAPR